LELLRLEAARLAQAGRYAHIDEVVEGVLSLLQGLMRERELEAQVDLPPSPPAVLVSQELLRQTLLGVLGYLARRAERCRIHLSAETQGSTMVLLATVEPLDAVRHSERGLGQERLEEFDEFASVSDCDIRPLSHAGHVIGFELQLPIAQRSVLVVDDNVDVLDLFRAYLTTHEYQVVTAQTTDEAIRKAKQFHPYAITLDLMMPEQDGWELLQRLIADPETNAIPIIVCTVLKEKELAIALGAAAYLEKPVTQEALLSALQTLEQG
jgi:CheY-like chemotaxis protein